MTTKVETERVYVCRKKLVLEGAIKTSRQHRERLEKLCEGCDGFNDECPKYVPQLEGGYFIVR